MPSIPKWMANAMEALFSGSYLPVKISEVEMLTKKFKLVRFEGELQKSKKQFTAGNIIEFRVDDTQFRHYTPSYFNAEKGICDVIFYLHNKGIGSKWAENLQIGDEIKLIGPGGKTKYNTEAKTHFIFGDETSIGLMNCLSKKAEEKHKKYFCLAELDENNQDIIEKLDCNIVFCKKSTSEKALFAIEKAKEFILNYNGNSNEIAFYLTGNAKSIANMRKVLIDLGINQKKQVQTEPYWVEGKKGL